MRRVVVLAVPVPAARLTTERLLPDLVPEGAELLDIIQGDDVTPRFDALVRIFAGNMDQLRSAGADGLALSGLPDEVCANQVVDAWPDRPHLAWQQAWRLRKRPGHDVRHR